MEELTALPAAWQQRQQLYVATPYNRYVAGLRRTVDITWGAAAPTQCQFWWELAGYSAPCLHLQLCRDVAHLPATCTRHALWLYATC